MAQAFLPAFGGKMRYNQVKMATIDTPKLRKPRTDPHLKGPGERVKRAAEELEGRSVADASGERVRSDLPSDMRQGVDPRFRRIMSPKMLIVAGPPGGR